MKKVDNYTLVEVIGEGAYGKVFLCDIRDPNQTGKMIRPPRIGRKVACKKIPTASTNANRKLLKYLSQEIDVMMIIDSPHVLSLIDAKKTGNNIYMFFEFCNGGDVRKLMKLRGGKLPEKMVKVITTQLA